MIHGWWRVGEKVAGGNNVALVVETCGDDVMGKCMVVELGGKVGGWAKHRDRDGKGGVLHGMEFDSAAGGDSNAVSLDKMDVGERMVRWMYQRLN